MKIPNLSTMKKRRLSSVLILLFTTLCLLAQNTMHVGSYNIRYANKGDRQRGNGWEERCPKLVNLINYEQWDVFGAQEVLHSGTTPGCSQPA